MKKNILTEIERVREIMGLIREQQMVYIRKLVSDIDIEIPLRYEYNYPTGVDDPSPFINTVVAGIIKEINSNTQHAALLKAGKLQLDSIDVKAGASNYWNKPMIPEIGNAFVADDNKTLVEVTDERWEELAAKDGYKGDWKKWLELKKAGSYPGTFFTEKSENIKANKDLATRRAKRFIGAIIPLFKEEKIDVSKLSTNPEGFIIDTGGATDDNNEDSKASKKGQALIITLVFSFIEKIYEVEEDCLVHLKCTIGYYTNKGQHNHFCDEAIFDVKMNGVSLGIANLNNGALDVFTPEAANSIPYYDLPAAYVTANDVGTELKNGYVLKKSDIGKMLRKAIRYGPQEPMEFTNEEGEKMIGEIPDWRNQFDLKPRQMLASTYAARDRDGIDDGKFGGSRAVTFTVTPEQATQIMAETEDEIILSMQALVVMKKVGSAGESVPPCFGVSPAPSGFAPPNFNNTCAFYGDVNLNLGFSGSHSDVPWVTIENYNGEVYDGQPTIKMKRGDLANTKLLTLNKCGIPITTKTAAK
jgi:hypothetical protein